MFESSTILMQSLKFSAENFTYANYGMHLISLVCSFLIENYEVNSTTHLNFKRISDFWLSIFSLEVLYFFQVDRNELEFLVDCETVILKISAVTIQLWNFVVCKC